MSTHKGIELLAPARNYQTAVAAIDCGADAVYMGAGGFGARAAACNSTDDIRRAVEYARPFGVKIYATLNTVLMDSELEAAERLARELIGVGVDAFIVQDMAYLRMNLGAELHASTQMFNAREEWVSFLSECGFGRIVLERNLSLDEIRRIGHSCTAELEAFVHGAVCVCYSGRCYFSRSMSARSGNRGECSQPCRMSYDLLDSQGNLILKGKHLMSVQDLDLSLRVGQLLDAGVSSLKIEGRLKDINYVRNTVALYDRVLNHEIACREGYYRCSAGRSSAGFEPDARKTFTRSGGVYYLDGLKRGVANFDTPKALGMAMGKVVRVGGDWFETDGKERFAAGDGICFVVGGELVGTNINCVQGGRVFPNRMQGIGRGVELFRNSDAAFNSALESARSRRSIHIKAIVKLSGEEVRVIFTHSLKSVEVSAKGTFDRAQNPEKMHQTVVTQISKSGGTVFDVESVELETLGEMPFVPSSVLNSLRREGLEILLEELKHLPRQKVPFSENMNAKLPYDSLGGEFNVTNRLAKQFYIDHGAKSVERGFDLREDLTGVRVLETRYCLRREIGECLKGGSRLKGPLYIEHGQMHYRIDFDCLKCEMSLVKVASTSDAESVKK